MNSEADVTPDAVSGISREQGYGKLCSLAYAALHDAWKLAQQRGNRNVELMHWIYSILQVQDSDLHCAIRYFSLDVDQITGEIGARLDGLGRNRTSTPIISETIDEAVKEGWMYTTIYFDARTIRTGHLLAGILGNRELKEQLLFGAPSLSRIKSQEFLESFYTIVTSSPEDKLVGKSTDSSSSAKGATSPTGLQDAPATSSAIATYTRNLTEAARRGAIDPRTGRDTEVRRVIDVLLRRWQNNPILTGEAGVGKTAIVEGLALKIAAGKVPEQLKNIELLELDVNSLLAGAGMRGEFEQRLKQLISEVQQGGGTYILFIDEAHNLIGAGNTTGAGDAANILKPALARGELRTIAATTSAEYKQHFEQDPALVRRFEEVHVEEPDDDQAQRMLRGVADALEEKHKVIVYDRAVEQVVKLSKKYVPGRRLPDKAVVILDTACSRVKRSMQTEPSEVEGCRALVQDLERRIARLQREARLGVEVHRPLEECRSELDRERSRLTELGERWSKEKKLADRVLALREALLQADATAKQTNTDATGRIDSAPGSFATELAQAEVDLRALQGAQPLIHTAVDVQMVASVIAQSTGVPVGKLLSGGTHDPQVLARTLAKRVIGQDHALELIANKIDVNQSGLDKANVPIGVFLLCGPSGVGKTETALALADAMFGSEEKAIIINMSEFQEQHKVSTLMGAPPGYERSREGGKLTEAVRRRPYSLVLLDEIEKAHPDVHEIFFQVFEKARMYDASGVSVDFSNSVVILTSNIGTDEILELCKEGEPRPSVEKARDAVTEALREVFPDAFLGRLEVVPYYPVTDLLLDQIIRLQLDRVGSRIRNRYGADFYYTPAVEKFIRERSKQAETGARAVDAIITRRLLPKVARLCLRRLAEKAPIAVIHVDIDQGDVECTTTDEVNATVS